MSAKSTEIDSAQVIENEFRIGFLERFMEWLLNNNVFENKPSQDVVDRIREETIQQLQEKYPKSGVSLRT